ncbi:MAG: transglutaminase domain-containing protein, partial [Candidatus Aenigmarchaeota archaeon]|nr:transglutaminase domain-containing protein [Candidatus Aenigmarchaeota archaeon]
MKRFLLVLLVGVLLIFPSVSADVINDPENVTYMKVEVTQSGHITLSSQSSVAMAEDLVLSLYVPQNDSRQRSVITKIIGPDTYVIDEGEYGNAQIVMSWRKPPLDSEIDYLVETLVEVEDESSEASRYFPVTSVVEPSQGIIETAYTVGGGDKAVENMLVLSNWVHENVDYDLSCEREAFPAKWVYDEGRGTCDEYSNLLLSMLRTLDYKAWYVAGYAYLSGKQEGGESFGSHAWVEGRLGGKTYSFDPTWAEAPVDATHITFARLPDSNFTEHTEVKSRDVSINWEKDETR